MKPAVMALSAAAVLLGAVGVGSHTGGVVRAAVPLPTLAPLYARPPSCPSGAHLHNVNPVGGAWIGRGPVQAISIWRGPRAILTVGPPVLRGYPQKVLWLVRRTLRQDVRVRGWNLRTGAPVWFGFADQGPHRNIPDQTVGFLDHRYPSAINPSPPYRAWQGYASEILVPSAGCYILYAQWKGDGWAVPFSMG